MFKLSWDIGLAAALVLLVGFSLVFQRNRALVVLLSAYASYFVASSWGEPIARFFSGDQALFNSVWIRGNASVHGVQAALLILLTFVLSFSLKLGGRNGRYGAVEVTAYAVSTVAVLAAFIILFLPDGLREQAMRSSRLLPLIWHWRQFVLTVPVLVALFFGLRGDANPE